MKKRILVLLCLALVALLAIPLVLLPNRLVQAQTTSSATISPATDILTGNTITLRVDNKYSNGITSLARLRAFVCANVKADGTPLQSSDVVAGRDSNAKLGYCQEVKAWTNAQTVNSGNLAAGFLSNQEYSKTFTAIRSITGDSGAAKCVQISATVTEPCRVKVIVSSGAGLNARGSLSTSGYPIHLNYEPRSPSLFALQGVKTVRYGTPLAVQTLGWTGSRALTIDVCTNEQLTNCSATGVTGNLTTTVGGILWTTSNTVTFSAGAPTGDVWLRLRDMDNGVAWNWASLKLRVLGIRALTLSSATIRLGEDTAVTLKEFTPGSTVRLSERVGAAGADANSSTVTVDSNGRATVNFAPSSTSVTHLAAVELDNTNSPIEASRTLTPITVQARACTGSLSFTQTGTDNVFGSLTVSGSSRSASTTFSRIDISDTRCVAAGWKLTANFSDLRIPGTSSNEFRIPASAIKLQVTCRGAGNSTAGLVASNIPISMVSGGSVELCRAIVAQSSLGTFTVTATVTVDVPISQSVGEYFATASLVLE